LAPARAIPLSDRPQVFQASLRAHSPIASLDSKPGVPDRSTAPPRPDTGSLLLSGRSSNLPNNSRPVYQNPHGNQVLRESDLPRILRVRLKAWEEFEEVVLEGIEIMSEVGEGLVEEDGFA